MKSADGSKLGLLACINIIVGGCIGSAIFSLSGQTIFDAGPASIVSWAVAALILALYGMQVCELAVRFPQSGGVFVFPQKAIGGRAGEFWGFISGWGYVVSNCIAVAFSAIYVSIFLGQGFPVLAKFQIPLAVFSVLVCFLLNLFKVTDTGKFNNILVGLLVSAMLVFVGISLFSGNFKPENFKNFFSTGLGIKGMFKSVPIAAVAYGACLSISFMVGEVENPNKTIPTSLIVGLVIVSVLYLSVITGTVGTFDYALFEQYPYLKYTPQFGSVFYGGLSEFPWMAKVIASAAFIALITTMLVLMALNARAVSAIAKSGYLPSFLAKENKNKVPSFSTAVIAAIAALLSLKPTWTEILVNLGALFSVITMVITCVSLVISRKKSKLENGMFKAPLGNFAPFLTIIVLGTCYLFGSISLNVVLFTLAIYALALIVFAYFSRHKEKAK